VAAVGFGDTDIGTGEVGGFLLLLLLLLDLRVRVPSNPLSYLPKLR
jgi:hypothetical protein